VIVETPAIQRTSSDIVIGINGTSINGCQAKLALDENAAAGFLWLPQCSDENLLGWGIAYQ
jgi:hypothetical protein